MRKGIRQGCPVSGMLFIIATEILATQIKQNHTLIKSIPLKDGYYCTPFLQYADDATLPLDGYQSLNNALSVINEFGDFSGLRLNMDKTEAIILGPLVNVEKPDDLNIKINNYYVKYLGIHVGSNLDMCYKLHWGKKVKSIELLLNTWKQRYLSIKGKIVLLKTLAISKVTMSLSLLPVDKQIIGELKKMFFNFI